ncbi:MAG: chemotaxis protein CheW [Deltaproteobacteria bacterium]|nr:MAG: chemotaxis protein CheW [Deltaproteobacteria bacterium]
MEQPSGAVHYSDQVLQNLAGKYLTFTLAGEEYGIAILKVKEIIGLVPITPVPKAPSFIKGVINLRGRVIPIMDLRLRFGMEPLDYNDRTCIIVVEADIGESAGIMGLVVDSVSEVSNISAEEIQQTPTFGTQVDTDFILGMAKPEGKVKILLDIDKVLSPEGMDKMEMPA